MNPNTDKSTLTPSSTRESVYRAIDGERDYQDEMWGATMSGGQPGNGFRSADEFALYISRYSNLLVEVAGTSMNDDDKIDVMRKIAALCVAATEWHGVVPRDMGKFMRDENAGD